MFKKTERALQRMEKSFLSLFHSSPLSCLPFITYPCPAPASNIFLDRLGKGVDARKISLAIKTLNIKTQLSTILLSAVVLLRAGI
jgi:hypothetical protein